MLVNAKSKIDEVKQLCMARNYLKAENILKKLYKEDKKDQEIITLLENTYIMNKKIDHAINVLKNGVKHHPDNTYFNNKLSILYCEQNNFHEAIKLLNIFLKKNKNVDALNNLGIAYTKISDIENAKKCFLEAINLDDTVFQSYNNLAENLYQEEDYDKALEHYDKCLSINPKYELAIINKGKLLYHMSRKKEAIKILTELLEDVPNNHDALLELASILDDKSEIPKSLELIEKAKQINPNDERIHFYLGIIYMNQLNYKKAVYNFNIAKEQELNAHRVPSILGKLSSCYAHLMMWDEFDEILKKIKTLNISRNKKTILPSEFEIFIAIDDIKTAYKMTKELFMYPSTYIEKRKFPQVFHKNKRLKIGYITPDTSNHPIALITRDVFKHHNTDNIETFLFPTKKHETDEHKNYCNMFENVVEMDLYSPYESAKKINDLNIDILIDLTGPTEDSAYCILEYQPATIQCHMLGHVGAICAPFIQYQITHPTIVPEETTKYFDETIVYLDNTNIAPIGFRLPKKTLSKKEWGLPENKFIFMAHQNPYRISRETFLAWLEIIKNVPNGILWILSKDNHAKETLTKHAKKQGANLEQILFYNESSITKNWQHKHANLFLDSFRVSSGTTILISQWTGVPVLTMAIENPKSRTAACYCEASGVPEQITYSIDEYIQRGIHLGNNPEENDKISQKILEKKLNSELFNTQKYIDNLEQSFFKMLKHAESKNTDKFIYAGDK